MIALGNALRVYPLAFNHDGAPPRYFSREGVLHPFILLKHARTVFIFLSSQMKAFCWKEIRYSWISYFSQTQPKWYSQNKRYGFFRTKIKINIEQNNSAVRKEKILSNHRYKRKNTFQSPVFALPWLVARQGNMCFPKLCWKILKATPWSPG